MTWILGSPVTFGYGALVADIRVSWRDGSYLDAVQKVHSVGNWMQVGFSGSVAFGFWAVDDMRMAFSSGVSGAWMPEIAATKWRRRARRMFAKSKPEVRDLGCSLLLVGVSPLRNGPFQWSRCIRMRAPEFEIERCRGDKWYSIGTGATHSLAEHFATMTTDEAWHLLKLEANNPGGSAVMVANLVTKRLREAPQASISEQLIIGKAMPRKHDIRFLDLRDYGSGWTGLQLAEIDRSRIVDTWSGYRQLAESLGLTAAGAAA